MCRKHKRLSRHLSVKPSPFEFNSEELFSFIQQHAYLVECAYKDTIWAGGIRLNEDERFDISKWRGQTILGFTLMEVLEVLRNI